jgi:hypothetical protein
MLANREIIENPKESIDRPYDISVAAKEELLLAFLQSILLDGEVLPGIYISEGSTVNFKIGATDADTLRIFLEVKIINMPQ